MMFFLRIASTACLAYALHRAWEASGGPAVAGDLTPAFYLSISVPLALLTSVFWAPVLGDKLSGPLTFMPDDSSFHPQEHKILGFIRRVEAKGMRRLVLFLSFLEATRHPDMPGAMVIGLRNTKAGSYWEKLFAQELFQFDNARNCADAYHALKRHGMDPRPHPSAEVNLLLVSLERQARPESETIALPAAPPPPPLERDGRIELGGNNSPARPAGKVRRGDGPGQRGEA